ncbi:MAG: B12-binding domain-containing protein [Pirellulaceae bacterium]
MKAVKLTPKRVAQAIGVSESSMKRWCDRGLIDFQKTAGGHRRISRASLVDFLRRSDYSLLKSELLGLPGDIRPGKRDIEPSLQEYIAALTAGDEQAAGKILYELFLDGMTVAELSDQLISPAFHQIGFRWQQGSMEIYQERRACEITMRVLNELRTLIPEPAIDAPLGIGGAPEKDPYMLPTTLVELVLRELGWRSQSLGSLLPLSTLAQAARDQQPRLFWLSVSYVEDLQTFLPRFAEFRNALNGATLLSLGGRALTEDVRRQMQFTSYSDNLQQFQSLASSMYTHRVTPTQSSAGISGT